MAGAPVWKSGEKRPQAQRRDRAKEQRRRVREQAIERDQGCVGPDRGLPGECGSPFDHRPPLEVHEIRPRGRQPGSHLQLRLCVTLCQQHHDMCTSPVGDVLDLVERCGLLLPAEPLPTVERAVEQAVCRRCGAACQTCGTGAE